jgi:hypothetical protein
MSINIVTKQASTENPFDSIRQVDKDGEFWSARDLMPFLDYLHWHKFKSVVEIAKENVDAAGLKIAENFLPVELKSAGRAALDYRLSRLAAYHVTLCCDSRGKNSVKLAKHYFAVKTREAEIIIPAQNDRLRELELTLELQKAKNESLQLTSSIISLHGKEVAFRLMGDADALVETKITVTEVVDPVSGHCREILTADQLKQVVKSRTGQKLPSLRWFAEKLRVAGRDDLLVPVTRSATSEYPIPDSIDEALDIVYGKERQRLMGE